MTPDTSRVFPISGFSREAPLGTSLTRCEFMALPIEARRRILEAQCTEEMVAYYATDPEVQAWLGAPKEEADAPL